MLGLPKVDHHSFDGLDRGCFVYGRKRRDGKSIDDLEFGGNN
jgi:hypothetical protein